MFKLAPFISLWVSILKAWYFKIALYSPEERGSDKFIVEKPLPLDVAGDVTSVWVAVPSAFAVILGEIIGKVTTAKAVIIVLRNFSS